jgi:hypothetical protein
VPCGSHERWACPDVGSIFGHRVAGTQQHGESTIAVRGRNVQADGEGLDPDGPAEQPGPVFGKKRREQDFWKQAADDRRPADDPTPWFLAEDDGPELEVEAGRSAQMDGNDDLGR